MRREWCDSWVVGQVSDEEAPAFGRQGHKAGFQRQGRVRPPSPAFAALAPWPCSLARRRRVWSGTATCRGPSRGSCCMHTLDKRKGRQGTGKVQREDSHRRGRRRWARRQRARCAHSMHTLRAQGHACAPLGARPRTAARVLARGRCGGAHTVVAGWLGRGVHRGDAVGAIPAAPRKLLRWCTYAHCCHFAEGSGGAVPLSRHWPRRMDMRPRNFVAASSLPHA